MKRIPASLFQGVLHLIQPSDLKRSERYRYPSAYSHAGALSTATPVVAANANQAIPKIIWTYWNQAQPEAFVLQCIDSWRRHCSDYEVRLVHPDNLDQWVSAVALPPAFAQLHPTKQSDWLRLYLVARYGGFWLDASTLLTTSLDWMTAAAVSAPEFCGFYLEKFTREPRYPVIESWAFGAPAGGVFITAWQREFHQALIEEGTQAYLARQQALPGWEQLLQGIRDPHYLLIHIAAQQVLQRTPQVRMALYKAEDTAYFYHHRLRWKWYLLYPQLCLAPAPGPIAPLVKLRGGERRHFGQMLALHGGARPGSLWQRALQAPI